MFDLDGSIDDEDNDEGVDDKEISLEDLESMENEGEHQTGGFVDEDGWGDSFDDLDGGAWEDRSNDEEDAIKRDPWELE